MRKTIIFLVLLIALSMSISCQNVDTWYTEGQLVYWNEPADPPEGVYTYSVAVIRKGADALDPDSYIVLADDIPDTSFFVDIFAYDYMGRYFVAVEAIDTYDGDSKRSGYIYSYVQEDLSAGIEGAISTFGFDNWIVPRPRSMRVEE